jgi:hypothetical protein
MKTMPPTVRSRREGVGRKEEADPAGGAAVAVDRRRGGGSLFHGLADPVMAMLGGGKTESEAAPKEKAIAAPPVFYELPEMLVTSIPARDGVRALEDQGAPGTGLGGGHPEDRGDAAAHRRWLPGLSAGAWVEGSTGRGGDVPPARGADAAGQPVAAPAKVNDVLFQDVLVQ